MLCTPLNAVRTLRLICGLSIHRKNGSLICSWLNYLFIYQIIKEMCTLMGVVTFRFRTNFLSVICFLMAAWPLNPEDATQFWHLYSFMHSRQALDTQFWQTWNTLCRHTWCTLPAILCFWILITGVLSLDITYTLS